MKKFHSFTGWAAAAAVLLLPHAVHAHSGHASGTGFLYGAGHPFSGLDHLLAMVAVGIWAAQLGGRALWMVPLSFLSVMAAGAWLGAEGISLPLMEAGIVTSVFLLGLLLASALRLPSGVAAALSGLFALCHGFAHGVEMPAEAGALEYAAGFLLSSLFLQFGGICLGFVLKKAAKAEALRVAGVAVMAAGFWLIF